MPDYGRHFERLEPWIEKLKLEFHLDDIVDVFRKVMLRYNGKLVSMPYDGDIHIMYWNKVAFERPDNQKKFKAKYGYDLRPPKTWKQWDDAAEFFHGWGWDGSQNKLFGAGASYKPSASGYSYHWWRQRRLEVLEEERGHHEGPRVHLAPRAESQDRDGPEDDHGPVAAVPSALGEVPQGVPRRGQIPRRHRGDLPVPGARPGDPGCR